MESEVFTLTKGSVSPLILVALAVWTICFEASIGFPGLPEQVPQMGGLEQ